MVNTETTIKFCLGCNFFVSTWAIFIWSISLSFHHSLWNSLGILSNSVTFSWFFVEFSSLFHSFFQIWNILLPYRLLLICLSDFKAFCVQNFYSNILPSLFSSFFPFLGKWHNHYFHILSQPSPASSLALILHLFLKQIFLHYIHLLCHKGFSFHALITGEIIIFLFVPEYFNVFPWQYWPEY